jgi:ankyrin repeat protein
MTLHAKTKEWALVTLISLTAVLANLPQDMLDDWGVNPDHLIAILAIAVFISLFFYLKFTFFLMFIALAAGGNMPAQIADKLGISNVPLILALAAMVGISLINYVIGLLPTGLEEKPKEKSAEGVKTLFYAIEKGNLVYAQKILSMNFDPNLLADNGYTPLMYAAARGNAQMVELLIRNGADVTIMSKDGDTALELALKVGSSEVADIIKTARADQVAREAAMAQRQGAIA